MSVEFIPKTSNPSPPPPRVAKYFSLFRTDTLLVCYISFRFPGGVPLILYEPSLFDVFQEDNFKLLFRCLINCKSMTVPVLAQFDGP